MLLRYVPLNVTRTQSSNRNALVNVVFHSKFTIFAIFRKIQKLSIFSVQFGFLSHGNVAGLVPYVGL